MSQGLRRRLFLVPLANNNHGKTTLVLKFTDLAEQKKRSRLKKGRHTFKTPGGDIDAYVFPRSFQEVERQHFKTPEEALDDNDPDWMQRDLIVMPSHLDPPDCDAMIMAGHKGGFDVVSVSVLLSRAEIGKASDCLSLPWDERWTIDNGNVSSWEQQIAALAGELWETVRAKLLLRV